MQTNKGRYQSRLNRLKARRKRERLDDVNKSKVDKAIEKLEEGKTNG